MEELPFQQNETLAELAQTANEKLESAGQSGANQAFNLGCTIGMAPAALLVILSFILGRANWVMAAVIGILCLMAILVLANLAAYQARKNNIERTYQREIVPEIESTLNRLGTNRLVFESRAAQVLPRGAALRRFFSDTVKNSTPNEESI